MGHFSKKMAAIALSSGLAACAIHPLPEDVTGYNTVQIVRKIRCEARDATIHAAIHYLQREGYPVADDVNPFRTINPATLKPRVRTKIADLTNTGIAYAFSLHGNEADGLSPSAGFTKVLLNGTETLNASAGNSLMRDNIRAFTITDNLGSLVLDTKFDHYCNFEPSGPNYEYPIVGRIGVDEMVRTFIALALTGNLSPESPGGTLPTNAPAMVDTITFTTGLSVGATPALMLNPVGAAWQLTSASIGLTAARTDTHQVTIGLALAKPSTARAPGPAPLVISAQTQSPGEAAAVAAVAQQILRFQVPRPLIVTTP